ncbi:Protein-arginine deiminase type III [Minicystis rosea]|nr:Protein-arginine deiminase type III [Minicystis rosea]
MRSTPRWLSLVPLALAAGCGSSESTNPGTGGGGGSTPQPVVALYVDADRDGVVDLASAGDRAHRNDFDDKVGASFLANLDDDDGDKIADAEDDVINGDADLLDLARFRVAPFPDAPAGAVGKVGVDAASAPAVRIFKKNPDGTWVAIAGSLGACSAGPKQPCAMQVLEATLTTDEVKAGVELGIEGRRFRASEEDAWSGDVDLTLKILDKEGGTPFTTTDAPDGIDHARMRVAPWVLFGNLSSFDTVWANNASSVFVKGLGDASKQAGVTLNTIKNWDDQWTQDIFQTAWTAIPGPGGVAQGMRIANARPWGQADQEVDAYLPITWLKKSYLGPDRGIIEIYKQKWSGETYDSHGNHDLIPAYENAAKSASFPLGRIITGSHVLTETGAFYDAQQLQAPHLVVKSDWLYVGHIDEFLSFVPAATPRGWKLLCASPRLARQMLEQAQTDGHGDVHMFVGKKRYEGESYTEISAETSIDDALADTDLMGWSQEAQAEIDAVVAQLKDEIGLADDEIIEIPTIYEEIAGGKVAWNPGLVNMLVMGNVIAPPDPFGPVIDGVDIFKKEMTARLGTDANALGSDGKGLQITFVDDWTYYHILDGEVHCGSNPEASAPFSSVKWWETGR